ncbi:hypothetical protein MNV_1550002 [Candidatus Methanoperedens nitroreducens]|uniref:Uncharacterized protein n=1 Tax=Candidatus Methanoperedens nitratireducens TaxID=1392998 RepID=A0A284VLA7_9EURY|nr:hypothetical protein MNV_1550002 [Candidatus Methanoperedens nitroreducens]
MLHMYFCGLPSRYFIFGFYFSVTFPVTFYPTTVVLEHHKAHWFLFDAIQYYYSNTWLTTDYLTVLL